MRVACISITWSRDNIQPQSKTDFTEKPWIWVLKGIPDMPRSLSDSNYSQTFILRHDKGSKPINSNTHDRSNKARNLKTSSTEVGTFFGGMVRLQLCLEIMKNRIMYPYWLFAKQSSSIYVKDSFSHSSQCVKLSDLLRKLDLIRTSNSTIRTLKFNSLDAFNWSNWLENPNEWFSQMQNFYFST